MFNPPKKSMQMLCATQKTFENITRHVKYQHVNVCLCVTFSALILLHRVYLLL